MKRKYAWCWIGLGTMLLLAALFLVLFNMHQDRQSGEASRKALGDLRQLISEYVPEETVPEETLPMGEDLYAEYETDVQETTEVPQDPVVELDGRWYTGIVSIPSLGIELPVLQDWSYPNLRQAPCRYRGAAAAGDLVIAAHNYQSHFGKLNDLASGEQILFTDVHGKVYVYEVLQTEMISGHDVDAMLDGSEEEWDLTLFTCTLSGQSRVSVRAVLIEE